jgi:hypothetical protein
MSDKSESYVLAHDGHRFRFRRETSSHDNKLVVYYRVEIELEDMEGGPYWHQFWFMSDGDFKQDGYRDRARFALVSGLFESFIADRAGLVGHNLHEEPE